MFSEATCDVVRLAASVTLTSFTCSRDKLNFVSPDEARECLTKFPGQLILNHLKIMSIDLYLSIYTQSVSPVGSTH